MDRRLFLFALTSALTLSGCITADNTLAPETVQSFKLADVAVTFPADARLNYTRAEDELATSRGVSPNDYEQVQALTRTPDGAAFIRDKARMRMQEAFRRQVGPMLQGTRPVRIEVAITLIDVPGSVRSVVLGGTAMLGASVKLVDAATGKVYLNLPGKLVSAGRAGGPLGTLVQGALEDGGHVSEPYQRLCETLAEEYAQWLKGSGHPGA